ncbi:4Fe-4S cluster-binding domain-containing protein [Tissierella sp. MB52-C2]|uniref:radical SAM/SPASM domain-containing protein n=1 Tax=Tissierella sp. MB52-C2 TaxID=3070999 RepID=UPI00280AB3DC|nr:radical SAM protein [Tissierella sp. MB52-C2]WMM25227.1 4Fe-4S cluster-binding domain-containing protein [Tissierella sp. MB52-C2]
MHFKFRGQRSYLDLENNIVRIQDTNYPIKLEVKPILKKLYVKFNSNCNINCIYCYQNSNLRHQPINNLSEYYNFLNRIITHFDEIYLFGGEPLIEDNISNVLKFLDLIYPKSVNIFTNGYHTDRIKDIVLNNAQLKNMTITIDGTEEFHTKRRVTNEYTYSHLLNTIKIYKLANKNVSIQINIDKNNNGDLKNTLEYFDTEFSNIGKINIILNRVLHTEYSYSQLEFMEYIKCLGNLNKYKNLHISINSNMLRKIMDILSEEGISYNRCEVGDTWVLDFNTSRIYTCPEDEKLVIGEFNYTDSFMDIKKTEAIKDYNNKNNEKCNNCQYKYICSRGCFIADDLYIHDCQENTLNELKATLDMLDYII